MKLKKALLALSFFLDYVLKNKNWPYSAGVGAFFPHEHLTTLLAHPPVYLFLFLGTGQDHGSRLEDP